MVMLVYQRVGTIPGEHMVFSVVRAGEPPAHPMKKNLCFTHPMVSWDGGYTTSGWWYTYQPTIVVNILLIMVNIWLMMVNNHLVGGWAPPLWKMMEFVSWDDDIPNIYMEKCSKPPTRHFQTNPHKTMQRGSEVLQCKQVLLSKKSKCVYVDNKTSSGLTPWPSIWINYNNHHNRWLN